MAIYRLELKHGTRVNNRSAQRHASYISRTESNQVRTTLEKDGTTGRSSAGEQAAYLSREQGNTRARGKDDLAHIEHGNMPSWAQEKPGEFWRASDLYERANGRLYSEMVIALPRELTPEQRLAAVQDFRDKEIADRHPYTLAIHNPKALDGGDQPHAHVQFSERTMDGIDRSAHHFFRRADTTHPELGGALKDRDWTRRGKLMELRASWAETINQHLERAGHDITLDHRSLKAQGIDRFPEPKIGPSTTQKIAKGIEDERAAEVIKIRELRQAHDRLLSELHQVRKHKEQLPERQEQAQEPPVQRTVTDLLARRAQRLEHALEAKHLETGKRYQIPTRGLVAGELTQQVDVAGRQYAAIDDGKGHVSLLPWHNDMHKILGMQVSYLAEARPSGTPTLIRLRAEDRDRDRDREGRDRGR